MGNINSIARELAREEQEEADFVRLVDAVETAQLQYTRQQPSHGVAFQPPDRNSHRRRSQSKPGRLQSAYVLLEPAADDRIANLSRPERHWASRLGRDHLQPIPIQPIDSAETRTAVEFDEAPVGLHASDYAGPNHQINRQEVIRTPKEREYEYVSRRTYTPVTSSSPMVSPRIRIGSSDILQPQPTLSEIRDTIMSEHPGDTEELNSESPRHSTDRGRSPSQRRSCSQDRQASPDSIVLRQHRTIACTPEAIVVDRSPERRSNTEEEPDHSCQPIVPQSDHEVLQNYFQSLLEARNPPSLSGASVPSCALLPSAPPSLHVPPSAVLVPGASLRSTESLDVASGGDHYTRGSKRDAEGPFGNVDSVVVAAAFHSQLRKPDLADISDVETKEAANILTDSPTECAIPLPPAAAAPPVPPIAAYPNRAVAAGLVSHLHQCTEDKWQPTWTVFPLKVFRGPQYKLLRIPAGWDDEALLTELRMAYDDLRTVWRKWFSLRNVSSITMVLADHSFIYPRRIGPARVSPSRNMRLRWFLHHPSYMRGRHEFMQVLTARTDVGIEFVERWQLSRIAVAVVLPVVLSVVLGVVYSIVASDPSTAFTLASYVTSAYSVCLVLVGLLNFVDT